MEMLSEGHDICPVTGSSLHWSHPSQPSIATETFPVVTVPTVTVSTVTVPAVTVPAVPGEKGHAWLQRTVTVHHHDNILPLPPQHPSSALLNTWRERSTSLATASAELGCSFSRATAAVVCSA